MSEEPNARTSAERRPSGGADNKAFQKAGLALLIRFHVLEKLAKIHDPKNDAFQEQGRALFESLDRLLAEAEEPASLRIRHGALLLNGVRLKSSLGTYPIFRSVMEELRRRELDAVTFKPGLTHDELFRFMPIFARRERKEGSPHARLQAEIDAANILHVGVEKASALESPSNLNRSAARIFFLSIVHLKESFRRNQESQGINVHSTRRLMQSIYNHIVDNESFVFGLTNLKNHDEYTLNHSVNVCILATALGRRLGLNRGELVDLGIAAFFHDLGKLETPLEILNKPDKLDDGEREIMEQHPFKGAEKLVLLQGSRRLPLRAIHVAMEHHIKEDLSGYPRYFDKADVNLFSKIVKVVDFFDAITTKRVYRAKVFTRSEALSLMLEQSASEFNPIILKAFVNLMGDFPIGSLVALDTGEMAVVFDLNPDPKLALRPTVKLITDASGNKIDGDVVDLAERDPATGRFARTILGALNPAEYGVEVSDYFLAQAQ
ncbi:MAG TPA: HD domain-containing protein [Candidatus Aminicenantes bacterium]|nr:HD domain-containing protein [Candidatus Aminicenantes bacterium]